MEEYPLWAIISGSICGVAVYHATKLVIRKIKKKFKEKEKNNAPCSN